MKMIMYSIKDTKRNSFNLPFCQVADEVCKRTVKRAVNDEKSDYYFFTSDYELWKIGDFDTENGIVNQYTDFMINLNELKEV